MDPTFIQPMQSVAAKMPGLIDEVYGDVPAIAAANLAPLTSTPQKLQPGPDFNQRLTNTLKGDWRKNMEPSVSKGEQTQAGPQTIQVSIPISIGKDQLGTVVTEIVDGRLGAVSYQGMAGY